MSTPYYNQDVEDEELIDGEVDLVVDYAAAGEAFADDAAHAALVAEAQKAAAAQQAVALQQVPSPVKKYIIGFYTAVKNNSLPEISSAYEGGWNSLTAKHYAKMEWPDAEVIAPLVENDQVFLILYKELWYRHVYSRLQPTGEDRFSSYDNYCDFFNYVLNNEHGPVPIDLPPQWLWDILDEFIYQYQSFSQWRNKVTNKNEEDLELLREGGVWSSYSVLNVLYSLIQKANIQQQLAATAAGADPDEVAGEYGSTQLYKLLGFFSLIGLLRVHVLLGDYTLALKTLDHIELGKKNALMTRVTACHVSTYYYVGFAYLMLGRFPDAIRSLTSILTFIQRLKSFTRSYQHDQLTKTADRMYALLAISTVLCPTRLDESLQSALKDKYGEQLSRMHKAQPAAFEELFLYAAPKFITTSGPAYEDPAAMSTWDDAQLPDPVQHQLKLFMADIIPQLSNGTVRSFVKLYKSLGIDKLAAFCDADEEEVVERMMVAKAATRQFKWQSGSLLDGTVINTSDLDFVLDADTVHVAEHRAGRRYGDWFLRNGTRMADSTQYLRKLPLPIAPKEANEATTEEAAPAPAKQPAFKPRGAWGARIAATNDA